MPAMGSQAAAVLAGLRWLLAIPDAIEQLGALPERRPRGSPADGPAAVAAPRPAMIKRRALTADLPPSTCCHTFRATGITAYLSNGGTLEHAQQIAGHASPKTTKLYDRTADTITVDEIERIVI